MPRTRERPRYKTQHSRKHGPHPTGNPRRSIAEFAQSLNETTALEQEHITFQNIVQKCPRSKGIKPFSTYGAFFSAPTSQGPTKSARDTDTGSRKSRSPIAHRSETRKGKSESVPCNGIKRYKESRTFRTGECSEGPPSPLERQTSVSPALQTKRSR